MALSITTKIILFLNCITWFYLVKTCLLSWTQWIDNGFFQLPLTWSIFIWSGCSFNTLRKRRITAFALTWLVCEDMVNFAEMLRDHVLNVVWYVFFSGQKSVDERPWIWLTLILGADYFPIPEVFITWVKRYLSVMNAWKYASDFLMHKVKRKGLTWSSSV